VKNIKYTRLFFFFNQRNVTILIHIKPKRSAANKSKYIANPIELQLLRNYTIKLGKCGDKEVRGVSHRGLHSSVKPLMSLDLPL
jgi:hypothetical protein